MYSYRSSMRHSTVQVHQGTRPTVSLRYPVGRPSVKCRASSEDPENNEGLKRILRKVQGALPVVGLISRLTTPEGGVGSDDVAYPEYCRQVFDAAPDGFQVGVAELQNRYGKNAQRRYVLLCLWMVKEGAGLCSGKSIMDAARRLRISLDIEFEMERFLSEFNEEAKKYTYLERPRGSSQERANLAVDAIARLILPIEDGENIPDDDIQFVEDVVFGGMLKTPEEFRTNIKIAIETRAERATIYQNTKF